MGYVLCVPDHQVQPASLETFEDDVEQRLELAPQIIVAGRLVVTEMRSLDCTSGLIEYLALGEAENGFWFHDSSDRSAHAASLVASLPTMRLSARNQLDGVVVRVEHGAVMSTVVIRLSGGQEIVSAITKDSAENLELTEGDAVKAVIKATEVIVGKD